MKISKSRVFTADIYEIGYEARNSDGKLFKVDDHKISGNVVCIKFKNLYVPVYYCKNALQYFDLSTGVSLLDNRFLVDDDFPTNEYRRTYLQNVKPLFAEQGKVSLKELVELQKKHAEEDDTFEPISE